MEYAPYEISVDLIEFFETVSNEQKDIYQKTEKILTIISRGSFLNHVEYDWLENIKSDISNKVIDELVHLSRLLDPEKDIDLMVRISNAIFHFDTVNEDALRIKCKSLAYIGRHSLAKNAYEHFLKDYQKMYGEPFSISFNELVAT